MNPTNLKWLLGGVLTASLTLNALQARTAEPAAVPLSCEPVPCTSDCKLDLDSMDLTESQRDAVRELCGMCSSSMADKRQAMDLMTEQLRSALLAEPVDEGEVLRLTRELGQLRTEASEECMKYVLQIRSSLEAEELDNLWDCCGPDRGKDVE